MIQMQSFLNQSPEATEELPPQPTPSLSPSLSEEDNTVANMNRIQRVIQLLQELDL